MSRRIAKLLDEPEHEITKLISKLEDKNGYPSHDARLLAEAIQQVRLKIKSLGLDPDDTTGEELYHALLVKFEKDSRKFDGYLKLDKLDFDSMAAEACAVVSRNIDLPMQWAIKSSVAKKIIRQQPPKHLMKHLRYRSVESLLKRENINEIFLAVSYLESGAWLKAHRRLISHLNQTDFEISPIKLQTISYDKWADIDGPDGFVASSIEVAAIGIWPSQDLRNMPLLSMVVLLAEELGKFQPIKISHSLAKMSKTVEWWAGMDHLVAYLTDEHVSLSIKDNAVNSLFRNDYQQRELNHGRLSFWQELVSRYENLPAAEAIFDESVREKISNLKFSKPEPAFEFVEDV